MNPDDFPESDERTADRDRLQAITDEFDAAGSDALLSSVMHPHAVLDAAYRRVADAGLGENEPQVVAAIMSMWTDGFLAGQAAMAQGMHVDLDESGRDT